LKSGYIKIKFKAEGRENLDRMEKKLKSRKITKGSVKTQDVTEEVTQTW